MSIVQENETVMNEVQRRTAISSNMNTSGEGQPFFSKRHQRTQSQRSRFDPEEGEQVEVIQQKSLNTQRTGIRTTRPSPRRLYKHRVGSPEMGSDHRYLRNGTKNSIDSYNTDRIAVEMVKPLNPLLSICGYEMRPSSFHCGAASIIAPRQRRIKVKRQIYQACTGTNVANADFFLNGLKQGNNTELFAETAVVHDSTILAASLRQDRLKAKVSKLVN